MIEFWSARNHAGYVWVILLNLLLKTIRIIPRLVRNINITIWLIFSWKTFKVLHFIFRTQSHVVHDDYHTACCLLPNFFNWFCLYFPLWYFLNISGSESTKNLSSWVQLCWVYVLLFKELQYFRRFSSQQVLYDNDKKCSH